MAELAAIIYPSEQTAVDAMVEVDRLQVANLIELADAAALIRQNDGDLKLCGSSFASTGVDESGANWGGLFGLMFLAPIAGLQSGYDSGGMTSLFSEYGVDARFVRELVSALQPGTSALCLLASLLMLDRVIDELASFNGRIICTSITQQRGRSRERLSRDRIS